MEQQMTTFYWLKLPAKTRAAFANVFDLKRTHGASVQYIDGQTKVISDGYTDTDLAGITVKSLQKFVGEKDEKDFWKLIDVALEKVNNLVV
jgi:hypothetical protein